MRTKLWTGTKGSHIIYDYESNRKRKPAFTKKKEKRKERKSKPADAWSCKDFKIWSLESPKAVHAWDLK